MEDEDPMKSRPSDRRGRHLRLVREPETAPESAPNPKRQRPVRVAASTTFGPGEVEALHQIFTALMRGGTMHVNERSPEIVSAYKKVVAMRQRIEEKRKERGK